MATVRLSVALRSAIAAEIIAAIDAEDPAPGYIELRTGTMPATPAAAVSGDLVGTLTFSLPCGTDTDGVITFDTITGESDADNAGTVSYGRIYDGDGTAVMDVDVGGASADAVIQLSPSATVTLNQPIDMSSLTITIPLESTWTRS